MHSHLEYVRANVNVNAINSQVAGMKEKIIGVLRELRDKVSVAYTFNSIYWLYACLILFCLWYWWMKGLA